MYSGHDRFVKFNRRVVLISNGGGGKIILKLIDGGARLLETPEYTLLVIHSNTCNHAIYCIRVMSQSDNFVYTQTL